MSRTPLFENFRSSDQSFTFQGIDYLVDLSKRLGKGGYGSVYKAVSCDDPSKPPLAVKFVTISHGYKLNIDNEATWNQKIYGVGLKSTAVECTDKHTISFLLMTLVSGENLYSVLERKLRDHTTVTSQTIVKYWILLALSVENFHKTYNAVHGDLKIGNAMLFIDSDGSEKIKLIDFENTTCIGQSSPHAGITLSDCKKWDIAPEHNNPSIKAIRAQDYYRLGVSLLGMLQVVKIPEERRSFEMVCRGLCEQDVQNRWCIPHAVYALECAFTMIPRYPASVTSCTLLDSQIDVLTAEIVIEENAGKKAKKTDKRDALTKIKNSLSDSGDKKSVPEKVAAVKKVHPNVTAGLFSRTEDLLAKLPGFEEKSICVVQ